MKANQAYFYRNRGQWDWTAEFELRSWSGLWKSNISFFSKVCLSLMVLVQRLLGPLRMWTCVDFQDSGTVVSHKTKLKKWGLTIYRSDKEFHLDDDGFGIQLEGVERFWPLSFIARPFARTHGTVEPSTTRASYQMPVAGALYDCCAFLERPRGRIEFLTPGLGVRFTLTDASNRTLESRLEERGDG